jgi:hypothetical protein
MFDDTNDDVPVPETMRPVRLIDARPGRLKHPESGPEVAILRFRSKRGTEQPLAICLSDVRTLIMELIRIHGHHEGVSTETVLNGIVADMDEPSTAPPDAPEATPAIQVAPERPKAFTPAVSFQMRFSDPAIRPVQVHVLGGYRLNWRRTILLVCCEDLGVLSLAEPGPQASGSKKTSYSITFTTPMTIATATAFIVDPKATVGAISWPKMSPKELRTFAHGKTWTYAAYQRLPKPGKKRGAARPSTKKERR